MSVLVLAENPKGIFKKPAFEAVHYGHLTAKALGTDCIAVVLGSADNPAQLGEYGASKVIHLSDCLLYTSPSPRDQRGSRMPSSA